MNDIAPRLFRIIDGAWRNRYTIIVPILVFPVLGLVVGFTSPKHYKAHTSMLIQETAKMNPFLEDFAVSAMLKERVEGLKTLLHSRHILNEVASDLGLIEKNSSDLEKDRVIAELSSNLSMQIAGKDLIRIDYRSNRKEHIQETLAAISRHFVEQLLAPERSSIKDSSSFLKQHLDKRRKELDKAEESLFSFRSENAETLPELHSSNIDRLNELKQTLAERKAELAGAVKNVGGLKQLLSRTNPVIGKLEEQIVLNRSELALLRARYTEKHSKIQAIQRTLRRLEAERNIAIESTQSIVDTNQLWDIASSQSTVKNGKSSLLISQLENLQIAKQKADGLTQEISRLEEMVQKLEQRVRSFGEKENQLIRLKRDLNVKRGLYEELLERYEMAQVTGSLGQFEQSKRVKIIDRPFTPSAPANPHIILFILAGLIGGIFLGTGLAIARELTDTTIRYKKTFEELSGLPVITRIPVC